MLNGATGTTYDRASAVEWLQHRLIDGGFLSEADSFAPGVYDQPTRNAVADLQNDLGITPDEPGVVDQATFNALLTLGSETGP